jgi:phage FluMu protein Com
MSTNKDAEKNALDQLDRDLQQESSDNIEKSVTSLGNIEEKGYENAIDEEAKVSNMGKIERFDYAEKEVSDTERKFGWHQLYAENFPSGGRYYSSDMKVLIKAATVNEIRHFSTIDENDPYSVDEAITDLLKICTKISFPTKQGSWKDIKEEDKIYLILSIRELTFAEDENRISFTVKCPSCKTENEMEIKNDNFQTRELPEIIAKYYNEEEKLFVIKSKALGEIKMQPPSVGTMRIVAEYIKNLQQAGENIKEYMAFLKILPYLSPEWRGLTIPKINNLKMDFLRWDEKKFLIFTQLSEKMQVGVQERMLKHCISCNEPIEAEIQLPTGIKGLFVEADILDDDLI